MVFGRDWKELTARMLSPAAVAQAYADADDAFAGDITTLGGWTFGTEEAARIKCPVLLILGKSTDATVRTALGELGIEVPDPDLDVFGEMIALQQSWLPQAELQTLDGINHALQVQDAAAVAHAVTVFLAKNRVSA
jgi:pimeloyl-ACP methyl ester carboxylesterase